LTQDDELAFEQSKEITNQAHRMETAKLGIAEEEKKELNTEVGPAVKFPTLSLFRGSEPSNFQGKFKSFFSRQTNASLPPKQLS